MTNEEALSTLRDFIGCLVPARASGKSILEYRRFEAFAKAIEALEKQIAKKPTHTYKRCDFTVEGCCPICGESVVFGQGCSNNECGQRIDWSDDE